MSTASATRRRPLSGVCGSPTSAPWAGSHTGRWPARHHGVKSYVDGAHATVQATLRVDNTSAHRSTLRVDQFRLRVTRDGKTLLRRPDGGNLSDTTLPEHSGLSGHLDFTIPRKGARLALVVTPAGPSGPVVIDLGRAAFGARAPGGHQH